jgi:hypothetical protein
MRYHHRMKRFLRRVLASKQPNNDVIENQITPDELLSSELNLATVREAALQVDKRLADLLDTKKTFDQRAMSLLGPSVSLALALAGASGLAARDTHPEIVAALVASSICMTLAAVACVLSLQVRNYGAQGTDPAHWLRLGTLTGGDVDLARTLAEVIWHHRKRISDSGDSNDSKRRWLTCAMCLAIAAPVVLAVVYFIFRISY